VVLEGTVLELETLVVLVLVGYGAVELEYAALEVEVRFASTVVDTLAIVVNVGLEYEVGEVRV
jgi:hypothetical protein